ncbi:MAG: hypothetical protein K9J30_06185 [Bacteroidales bacterium]|nr:hypothetical protein [Bacteroidales bacterium]
MNSSKSISKFIRAFPAILEQLEEIDDIRAYDAAKAEKDEIIPFDQAVNEIGKEYRFPEHQVIQHPVTIMTVKGSFGS